MDKWEFFQTNIKYLSQDTIHSKIPRLQNYNYEVINRQGKRMHNVDALSRC